MNLLAAEATFSEFTCLSSDSILVAAERCLDNGTGVCFIVDGHRRLLGRITLDHIRAAVVDGRALLDAALERLLPDTSAALAEPPAENEAVMPVLAEDGRLIDVLVDRSKAFVQVARPDLSHHEFRAVLDAFLSSWISSKGAYIERFERDFASFVGMKHAIATSNGTVALHLALVALGIGPGDEVIVPDLTFAATINAVLYCGATPVIIDVDPVMWTMSLKDVTAACTARTKAIIPVHLYGRPAEMAPIAEFAARRKIHIVEDCAEAHGAKYAGRTVGQFSEISCFSFYANKIVTTGEGGMCVTNSLALAAVLQELRSHGMAPNKAYWHDRVGYNYRMTNLQAAIGHSQLHRIGETLRRNSNLERLYRRHLETIPGVSFAPLVAGHCEPVVWLVCARVPADSRADIIAAAAKAGLELRPFFHRLSDMPPYRAFARACPVSAELARTGINLPTSNAVDLRVIEKIASVFRDVLGQSHPRPSTAAGDQIPLT
ncbi:MAG TPA: aminotransferase class I/II-fold pyridoxal phosphate-dependent enzyme [Alphaproteobacteria bacterium]